MRARERVKQRGSARVQPLQRLVGPAFQRALFRHAFVALQHRLHGLGKTQLLRAQRLVDEQRFVYDENRVVAQIIQQRFRLFIQQRQQYVSADAGDAFAPRVFLIAQSCAPGNALERFLRELFWLRGLQRGTDDDGGNLLHAALGNRIKSAHLVDFVAEKLNADGVFLARGKHVHNISARGALSAPFDQLHPLIARRNQPLDERSGFQRVANRKRKLALGKRAFGGECLHQRGGARRNHARFAQEQRTKRGDARAAVFSRGGVDIDQRRFTRQKQLRTHAKEARALVKLRGGNIRCGHKQHLPRPRERSAQVCLCVCGNAKRRDRAFAPLQRQTHALVIRRGIE